MAAVGHRSSEKGRDRREKRRGGQKRKAKGDGPEGSGSKKQRETWREIGIC